MNPTIAWFEPRGFARINTNVLDPFNWISQKACVLRLKHTFEDKFPLNLGVTSLCRVRGRGAARF